MIVTRFAPSPSGYLHLGHAYSAGFAWSRAQQSHGSFILRIEDIDLIRCKPEFEQAIFDDLAWLGLHWQTPVRRQSDHLADYQTALARLDEMGLLYPCFCTRKQIQEEIEKAASAPHGPDGALYPGTCRALSKSERQERLLAGERPALRLDMKAACHMVGRLTWHDHDQGEQIATPEIFGDAVLARKDTPTSYHLSVTLDDHLQGVTLVTRGEDLFAASHIHRLLQALLELNVPAYHHHPLLCGEDGKRFAKRDRSLTLRSLREQGVSPEEIFKRIGLASI